jgi:hypothetical protein
MHMHLLEKQFSDILDALGMERQSIVRTHGYDAHASSKRQELSTKRDEKSLDQLIRALR